MTTQEIRNNIFVFSWTKRDVSFCSSFYITYRFHKTESVIKLSKDDLISELIQISSIDNESEFEDYTISQWDVLCLAIRHELKEATNKEIEHLFKL